MLLPDLIVCPINFTMLAAPVPLHALESLQPLCPCLFWRACGLCTLARFGALCLQPCPCLQCLRPLESLRPLCPCLQCLRPLCRCMVWRACGPCSHAYNACGLCARACFEELAAPVHLNIAHQKFYEGPKNLWTEGLKNLMNLRAQEFLWAWASNKNTAKQDMSTNLRPPKFHEPKTPTNFIHTRHQKSYSMNRRHQKSWSFEWRFFWVARFLAVGVAGACSANTSWGEGFAACMF